MEASGMRELRVQRFVQGGWQHRPAILASFAMPNRDLTAPEVEILHPQTKPLEQAQAASVQQVRDQPVNAAQLVEQGGHLRPCQHDGQPYRPLRALDAVHPGQLDTQHFAIEKQQRCQCLVLRRRSDVSLDRQAGEKSLDLWSPKLARVSPLVRANETADDLARRMIPRVNAAMLDRSIRSPWEA
jgi:hypothetical protein